ncbi:MAG: hypothetical protein JO307_06385 [Bryobacterales bacterium]|nr:hypothetical protein [Bryobacterales bacterium]MBV9398438.1 hypothetical protein [Bryobacterales bacterium]
MDRPACGFNALKSPAGEILEQYYWDGQPRHLLRIFRRDPEQNDAAACWEFTAVGQFAEILIER